MDLLLFVIRGISIAAHTLRTHRILPDPQVNAFVIDALFSTITNANFDEKSITERINRGFNLRNRLVAQASSAGITFPSADELTWNGAPEAYDDKAAEVGVLREPNEDLRSLKELIVYGLKGMAAYTGHAMRLGYDNPALHEFIHNLSPFFQYQMLICRESIFGKIVFHLRRIGISPSFKRIQFAVIDLLSLVIMSCQRNISFGIIRIESGYISAVQGLQGSQIHLVIPDLIE